MAISLGRGRRSSAPGRGEPNPVVRELRSAETERFTGALEFEEEAHGTRACLYLYEGNLYAVELAAFHVDPMTRLVSAGLLDPEAAIAAGHVTPSEAEVVKDGLVDIDAIARVHQEFLLAGAGAVIGTQARCVGRLDDAVTSDLCTVPVALDDVLEAVELRRERLAATWGMVSSEVTPSRAVLRPISRSAELPGSLPELRCFARELDSVRSVDAIAGSLGLTRAEAVHLAASLVAAGLTGLEARQSVPSGAGLLVPEAFGEVGPGAGIDAPTASAGTVEQQSSAAPLTARLEELEQELAEALLQQKEVAARVEALGRSLQQARAELAQSGGQS